MWPNLGDDRNVHARLSISTGINHPEWDGVSTPSKNAVLYMQALQGRYGPLFGRMLARSVANAPIYEKSELLGEPYADFFEWWRRFLMYRGVAMVLPFHLDEIGEPRIAPQDQRYVQKAGKLYVYGSSSYEDRQTGEQRLIPNTYVRG